MMKEGIAMFRVSPAKVFKKRAAGETPTDAKCCEVCGNEGIMCETYCKYSDATYREFLDERFG